MYGSCREIYYMRQANNEEGIARYKDSGCPVKENEEGAV